MSFSFQIVGLIKDENGVVISVKWAASLTDDDLTESMTGSVQLNQKNPSDPDFIDFNDLTEVKVLEWFEEKVKVSDIHDTLMHNLNVRRNPSPRPSWASIEEAPPPWAE